MAVGPDEQDIPLVRDRLPGRGLAIHAIGMDTPPCKLAVEIQGIGQQQHLPQAGDVAALLQGDIFLESQAGDAGDLQF